MLPGYSGLAVLRIRCWCSMVLACPICSRVHRSNLLSEELKDRMDNSTSSNQEIKKHVRLQDRRGSNVSLVLDMSSLSNTEPILPVSTPKDVTVQLLKSASHVLTQDMLQQKSWSLEELQAEFAKIPSNFASSEELDIPGRAAKDRYKSILPNPQSRVYLKRSENQDEESYINANYIRGYDGQEKAYIATQGPMLNTVNDFWTMVWQEQVPLIVMLTKLKEEKEKCICYWPETETNYGSFSIRVQGTSRCEEHIIQDIRLQYKEEHRNVKHIIFSSWPDQKAPASVKAFLNLVLEVDNILQASESTGPIVVHCSAGIGRTGCFIATHIGCQQLKDKREVDILGIVCRLRIDRGGMIQTSEQYQFLHHTLSMYASQLH